MADDRIAERGHMVETQVAARGVRDPAVIDAMLRIPRHLFIPETERGLAYSDGPVAIGHGQTISQPFIVGLMTELAGVGQDSRVLEIGTGGGYQTAVLAAVAREVWTVEIEPALAARAAATLEALGVRNVHLEVADGSRGWPGSAPYDAIVVTAAPADVPPALVEQLAEGGRLVIPVGDASQELWVITREGGALHRRSVLPVRFVPLR